MFDLPIAELLGPPREPNGAADRPPYLVAGTRPTRRRPPWPAELPVEGEDTLYENLDDVGRKIRATIGPQQGAPDSLDTLEEAVELKARLAVDAPPHVMIADLSGDLHRVHQMLCDSSGAQVLRRRLLRAGALFSALLGEEFMIIGQATRSRRWFRTADELSRAADDSKTRSLVGCLASRLPLYFGEIAGAVDMARRVSDIAPANHLSAALAPMVEALALAQLGDRKGSRDALDAAREAFDLLDGDQLEESVFGFSARRFAFYESRALLDTGRLSAAWRTQEDALALYPSAMIGDVAMIHLDRARLLVKQGSVDAGCAHATEVLQRIPEEQRAEIFYSRALRLLASVPRTAQTVAEVAALREQLVDSSHSF